MVSIEKKKKIQAQSQQLVGDRVLMAAIVVSAITAVVLGANFVESGLAWGLSALFLAVAGLVYAPHGGTVLSLVVLTAIQTSFVALHIHLAQGLTELHFGVFVTLALLMVYLDWRPIVFSAVLFAVHHVLFDRLQAAGWGCTVCQSPASAGSWCTRRMSLFRPGWKFSWPSVWGGPLFKGESSGVWSSTSNKPMALRWGQHLAIE